MHLLTLCSGMILASAPLAATLVQHQTSSQEILKSASMLRQPIGVGHFSEWSRATKRQFFLDWQVGKESEWTLVMGNEGGDLDSMASALAWAYHVEHATQNSSEPRKAIALLQTPMDALDLRPENQLALANSKMTEGHEDLLTLDELPEDPETLSAKVRGIILVDHAEPLRKWDQAKILSIFDHHVDRGRAPDASPRVFEKTASCTSLVARQMLDELEQLPQEYHLAHELLELLLSAIAIDANGLEDATPLDHASAARVLARSRWSDKSLPHVMTSLSATLRTAKAKLDHLGPRDLLRRDWKGDLVDTTSPRTPTVSLGFASIPYSLDEQISRTGFGQLFHWFATHAAWTASTGADISICLNKYKTKKKRRVREIVLTVRDDVRIDEAQAESLFRTVSEALESHGELGLRPWHGVDKLAPRQMVWEHETGAGRKEIRPIVEDAVKAWDMQ